MARKSVLFFLAILCLAAAAASDELLEILKNRSATIYCGRNLADVLSLVCKGKYNAPTPKIYDRQKRDSGNANMRFPQDDGFLFPFISRANTEHFLATYKWRRRARRGVYNECCQNPCSYEVLKSYCAD